jgi:hypothetical protein
MAVEASVGYMSVEVSVGYMSVGWACGRACGRGALGERPSGEGGEWEEWEGSGSGRRVGWEGRDSEPNGTATEHREGGGPFGSESLYICRVDTQLMGGDRDR